jgi:hypothetical protein
MAIRHTPRPLKGKNHRFWICGMAVGLTSLGLMFGVLLMGRWIGSLSTVTLAAVIFAGTIFVHVRLKRRLKSLVESTTPCPECGQCRMNFREDRKSHAFLICPYCGIKWDIGQI